MPAVNFLNALCTVLIFYYTISEQGSCFGAKEVRLIFMESLLLPHNQNSWCFTMVEWLFED